MTNKIIEESLKQREEIAYFMRRLYKQNLTTSSGGNISVKIDENHIAITPSALDKARLTADLIGIMTLDGKNITTNLKPTIESNLHLAIYKNNKRVKAIVHAHPVHATSFAASEEKINTRLNSEAYAILGQIERAPYALMGSEMLAKYTSASLKNANSALMTNHGAIAIGISLFEAFDRMEVLENSAKITIFTGLIGKTTEMNDKALDAINKFMER